MTVHQLDLMAEMEYMEEGEEPVAGGAVGKMQVAASAGS